MTFDPPLPTTSLPAGSGQALGQAVAELLMHRDRRPRLLGFGEPMHGEEEFSRLRNELFAYLVEHAGYRSIALESCCWAGQLVDAYVGAGQGDEDDVIARGFSHGFDASPANLELVRWMRSYNLGRPAEQRLRFAGFDAPTEMTGAQSPRWSLTALHAYLRTHLTGLEVPWSWQVIDELLGDDDHWTEPAAMMDPTRSIGAHPQVPDLRVITDELRWLLACEAPALLAATSAEQLWAAQLAGRTAAGLLAYHTAMARNSDSAKRWQHLAALRDAMMADNLHALADREADRGPTLVFAHNQHLRTGTTWMTLGSMHLRWQPAGAHLASRLRDGYMVIGSALGRAAHQQITEPDLETVEGALYTLPSGNHLFTAGELLSTRDGRRTRTTENPSYFTIDDTVLHELDAVLFLRDITHSPSPAASST